MKNISFLSENFQFLGVKFSIYLNRHIFVMIFSRKEIKKKKKYLDTPHILLCHFPVQIQYRDQTWIFMH